MTIMLLFCGMLIFGGMGWKANDMSRDLNKSKIEVSIDKEQYSKDDYYTESDQISPYDV